MEADYPKYTLELAKLGWVVEIHDGKSIKYAPTKNGIESLDFYKKMQHHEENPKINDLEIKSERCQWLVKNGILVRHYDMNTLREAISATPYGFGLFSTMEFWLNAKLQKRLKQRKKISDFLADTKKGMEIMLKLVNKISTTSKSKFERGL